MPDDVDEFLREFLVESYENLDTIETRLIALESAPDPDAVPAIFRAMHTIKGTSGFFGFGLVERVAHVAENLLGKVRDGALELTEARASALLAANDVLRGLLGCVEATGTEPATDIADLVTRLEALTSGEAPAEVAATASAGAAAASADTASVEAPGTAAAPTGSGTSEPPAQERRSQTRRADDVIAQAERLLVDAASGGGPAAPSADSRHAEDSTIRLDVGVLDELMNLVGELVLARNSLVRSISRVDDRSLLAQAQRIDLVTSELQARVLRTRMRPVRTVWSKLPRLVREVSLACGRQVTLELEGEDTELDKSVVEAIKDPMTHCVRNAVDHGIEPPEERVAAGKPAAGRLHLRAAHENGQVVIQVSDDGRGIDPDKLRRKAVEKGLLTEEVALRTSDRDMLDMIFDAGFSTAEKVTEVSGRGVGMDVVRTNIERIGGSVSVSSVVGQGSTFSFTIPLTLAIIPALLVAVDGHRYAIPQSSLVELVRLTGEDATNGIEDMHGLSVHRLRGRLLPIVDGARVLGVERSGRHSTERMTIAVLQVDGGAFGLVVDDVLGTEEIVVKPIGGHYSGIGVFAGATILGDGVVSLIIDVAGLANKAEIANANTDDLRGEDLDAALAGDDLPQYIIVATFGDERHAIPLERVARLEKFQQQQVERVTGDYVVQYRDGLLPLITLDHHPLEDRQMVVTAILSSDRGEVGLAVDRVVDVAAGTPVPGGSVTVAGQRATEVVDVDQLVARCAHLCAGGV